MNKTITTLITLAILSLTSSHSVYAVNTDSSEDLAAVVVTGKIKTSNGQDASDALVTVKCGNTEVTKTDGSGVYEVVFRSDKCPLGSIGVVNAKQKNEGARGSVKINSLENQLSLNLGPINRVPEFGAITGIVAVAGSAASYIALKRRSN